MDFIDSFFHQLPDQDKFLSRLFGIFSEKIVRIWASDERAPYEDLGRPTVRMQRGNEKGATYDFTLRERKTGRVFVCEQKCELEYQNYKYIELKEPEQLEHHKGNLKHPTSFARFLDVGKNPGVYRISVPGEQPMTVSGIILIWGKVLKIGKEKVRERYGIYDVLSLEDIVNQLLFWESKNYYRLIKERQDWSNTLFEDLVRPRTRSNIS